MPAPAKLLRIAMAAAAPRHRAEPSFSARRLRGSDVLCGRPRLSPARAAVAGQFRRDVIAQGAQRSSRRSSPLETTQWWRTLRDRELDSLVERAIAASPSLEIALDRLQQARAQEAVRRRRGAAVGGSERRRRLGHRQRFGPRPRLADAGLRRERRRRGASRQHHRFRRRLGARHFRPIPARDRSRRSTTSTPPSPHATSC